MGQSMEGETTGCLWSWLNSICWKMGGGRGDAVPTLYPHGGSIGPLCQPPFEARPMLARVSGIQSASTVPATSPPTEPGPD